jgi:hypothetical protein
MCSRGGSPEFLVKRVGEMPKIPKLRRLLRINLMLKEIGKLTSESFVIIGSVALLLEMVSQDDHKVVVFVRREAAA